MKRKPNADGAGSLDSLLDTMTNVAGILVIVLVVTTLNVKDVVNRIRSTLPEVTAEEVEAKVQEEVQSRDMVALLEKQVAETPKIDDPDYVKEQILEKAEQLRKEKPENPDMKRIADEMEALRNLIAESKEEAKKMEAAVEQQEGELAALKVKLDTMPLAAVPAPKSVRMPNPQPAPEGADAEWFLCRAGRVLYCDLPGLQEIAREAVFKNAKALAAGQVDEDDVKKTEFDGSKVEAFFQKNDIGDKDFRVTIRTNPKTTWATMDIAPRKAELAAGDPVEKILSADSRYYAQMRQVKWRKNYAQFLVWSDGFEAYLAARRIAEKSGLPAGWHPFTSDTWSKGLPGVRIKLREEPPPPDPNAKPAPAPAPAKQPPPPELID